MSKKGADALQVNVQDGAAVAMYGEGAGEAQTAGRSKTNPALVQIIPAEIT